MSRSRTVACILSCLALTGCAANDPLAEQYREGTGQNYIAGDGSVLEIAPGNKDALYAHLMAGILTVSGPYAVPVAVTTLLAGRALERIADHTVIVGERLRFLLTGDPAYLASEVR